ncbi:MAG: hypothetical protein QM755_21220 [Luteolibacter sp.]
MMTPVLPPLVRRFLPAPLCNRLRVGLQLALWLGLLWMELFVIALVRSHVSHPETAQAGMVENSPP